MFKTRIFYVNKQNKDEENIDGAIFKMNLSVEHKHEIAAKVVEVVVAA